MRDKGRYLPLSTSVEQEVQSPLHAEPPLRRKVLRTLACTVVVVTFILGCATALEKNAGFNVISALGKKEKREGAYVYDEDNAFKDNRNDPSSLRHGLKVALLMSFPNSGTSYTLRVARQTSNTSTATNHCEGKKYIPVFETSSEGPHLIDSSKPHVWPEKFILTKTHCAAKCEVCSPSKYVVTSEQFLYGCLTSCDCVPETGKKGRSHYDAAKVGKLVHLFRDPFDNIISRFHLHRKRSARIHRNETYYESDPSGFKTFCSVIDSQFLEEEGSEFGMAHLDMAKSVPCHADFFRYVQWHNLAFEASRELDLPTHILHYEDYRNNFNVTLANLLRFLEQPIVSDPTAFYWSNYSMYYSEDQRRSTISFMKTLASPRTWDQLTRYYFQQ